MDRDALFGFVFLRLFTRLRNSTTAVDHHHPKKADSGRKIKAFRASYRQYQKQNKNPAIPWPVVRDTARNVAKTRVKNIRQFLGL